MAVFFAATAAVVTGLLPLEPRAAVWAIYALELLTVAALVATWRRVWKPAALRADRRLAEPEDGAR